ncbi:MAG: homoserine dehydrogenase [Clostridia bacterium]|nr:homoserine dehydrogenase [Clostridia bacterium]
MISIAILGHGVVGSGVAEILMNNADGVAAKAGDSLQVKRILDLRSFPDLPYAHLFTTEFQDILQDVDIRIVVETMGGLHPAYEFVKACLEAGKSVVTSNKELVAAKGDELLTIARERNLNFLFEASVGGGIPILRPLDQCLAANRVQEVAGILNGTTNFMLAKMIEENMAFGDALALAQKLGYAERDPSADIEGHDACRKICILAALAFGRHVWPEQVHTEGITGVSLRLVQYAAAAGGAIKLIGRAVREADGRVFCLVAPMLVPGEHLLSQVDGVFNGITVRGDSVGDVTFVGRGAGKLPTASAVVADVIDEARHTAVRKPLFWETGEAGYVADYRQQRYPRLLRLTGGEGLREQAVRTFDPVQVLTLPEGEATELAVITPALTEAELEATLAGLTDVTVADCVRVYSPGV